MKTKIFLIIAVLFTAVFAKNCFAQQIQLTVTGVDNFPVLPNDTAHELQTDTLVVHVFNLAQVDSIFNDTLWVFLQNADTVYDSIPEVLVNFFVDTLHANDSLNFEITYQYTQSTLKAGNNIVVVWPRMGGNIFTTHDSLIIDTVYFDLLASINILNSQNETFSFFPNPATNEITLNKEGEKFIEYVRILNDIGQELLYSRTFDVHLDVRFLSEGLYFIEIKERNGTISRKKFLKL